MATNIIEAQGLEKSFRIKLKNPGLLSGLRSLFNPEYKVVEAVHGIDLSVSEGEIVAFLGPNGAGKSTTIKMFTGILFRSGGSLSVLGLDPEKNREKLSFQIGTVFGQRAQLWFHLAPADSFELFSRMYEMERADYQSRLKRLVAAFDVERHMRTPVRKLSLGERMRCELVASLLHRPKVLFLDEPTIGLDVIAKQQIREVLRELNQQDGVTIFLTSHDTGDVEALAKRSIVINHGTIVLDDTTENFRRRYVRTKTVELVVNEEIGDFAFAAGVVVSKGRHNVRVELDLERASIEQLIKFVLSQYSIVDINIFEPDMEQVVSMLYRESGKVTQSGDR